MSETNNPGVITVAPKLTDFSPLSSTEINDEQNQEPSQQAQDYNTSLTDSCCESCGKLCADLIEYWCCCWSDVFEKLGNEPCCCCCEGSEGCIVGECCGDCGDFGDVCGIGCEILCGGFCDIFGGCDG